MRILKIVTLALTATTLLSCGQQRQTEGENQQFKTMSVKTEDVSLANSYSASIRGRQDIKIVPRVDGYLTDILIKEGSRVRKGERMFIIDQTSFKAALEAARATVAMCEAGVATAELTRDSKKALFDKKIVSNFDLVSAENALKTAKAQLQQAKAQEAVAKNNLSFTVIESPSDGVVGKIPFRKGDYVGPSIQEGLTIVADNTQMYVYFSMTERQVMELISEHKSMDAAIEQMPAVELRLNDGSIYTQKGKVESISGVLDAATGAASVRAVFANEGGMLLSGGAGSVVMPYLSSGVIVVPQQATYEVQDKTYVFKVVDGVAVSTIVTVAKINNGREFIVTGGLVEGDVIIAEGAGLVREGTKVSSSVATDKKE